MFKKKVQNIKQIMFQGEKALTEMKREIRKDRSIVVPEHGALFPF